MRIDWTDLREELAKWREEGLDLPLWWRDDDATHETVHLHRLLDLGAGFALPVHLAVIPKLADPGLADLCHDHPYVRVLVHGWAHENHAPDGRKKAEFGHPRSALAEEAAAGLNRLKGHFGKELLSVFVPPWNRIDPTLVAQLPGLGYSALSSFTSRRTRLINPELVQINTHLDPIDWRGGGGLAAPEGLVAELTTLLQDRRAGRTDRTEPLGLLTHHLVHNEEIWDFTRQVLTELLEGGARPCDLAQGLP